MTYYTLDRVSGERRIFDSEAELKQYADIWCDRLNEERENIDEKPVYKTTDIEHIREVFECCNIDLQIK